MLTTFSKIFGFFREMLLAWNFGDSPPVEALNMAASITGNLFGVVTAVVAVCALPLYTDLAVREDKATGKAFLLNLTNILLLATTLLAGLVWLLAPSIVGLFASGFSAGTFALTVEMLRINLFVTFFHIFTTVVSVFLQSERKLLEILLANMVVNMVQIPCILLAAHWQDPLWLARGMVMGAAMTSLVMYIWSRKHGFHWRLYLLLSDPLLKRVLKMMLPAWTGMLVGTISAMVDRTIASSLEPGSVAAIAYASTTIIAVTSFFVPTIILVTAPLLAESAVLGIEHLKTAFSKAVNYVILFTVPMVVGISLIAENAVSILFGHGAFGAEAIILTSRALIFMAPNIFVMHLIADLVNRFFLSLQDTLTPNRNGMIGLGVGIIFNLLFSQHIGILGLVIASTMSNLIFIALGVRQMRLSHGGIGGTKLLRLTLWSCLAALVMGVPVLGISLWVVPGVVLRWQRVLLLLFQVVVGALTYVAVIIKSRLPEVTELSGVLRSRVRGGYE